MIGYFLIGELASPPAQTISNNHANSTLSAWAHLSPAHLSAPKLDLT